MGDARVSAGVLFVGRYRIPPGALDEWRAAQREMTAFVEANLPDVLAFDAFLGEDGTEATSIHFHRDAASFDRYLETMATRIGRGTQIVEVIRIDLYGEPSAAVVEHMRRMGSWPVAVWPHAHGLGRTPT
jgi:hypothetical protein